MSTTPELATRRTYRGPDRRRPVEAVPAAHPATARMAPAATAALASLGGLVAAILLAGLDLGPRAPSPAGPLEAVAAVLAVHLALSAWICGRATGQALCSRLAVSAALLAVALAASVDVLPSGWLLRGVALLLAATWAAYAVLGPEVDERRRILRHASLSGLAVLLVLGAVLTVGPAAPALLVTGTSVVAVAVWTGALALWTRAWRRHRTDPVLTWAIVLPLTIAVAEVLLLVGPSGVVRSTGAVALHAGGLFAASVGMAVALGAHVTGRRAELLHAEAEARSVVLAQRRSSQERDHEVRNALFAIEGAASMLERHAGRLDTATTEELAGTVATGLTRLWGMLEHDPDRGGVELLLARIVGERAALANRRGVTTTLTGDLEVVGRGDGVALGQVVDNLLLNAVRHGGAGEQHPVTLQLGAEEGRATIRVMDRGPGIAPADAERVFERGTRLDVPSDGDGLGLYLSRRLLRELGGDLVVDTSHTSGACLVASLPLVDPEAGRG